MVERTDMGIRKGGAGAIDFGNRLRELRTSRGIQQQEMASILGVSLNTYGRYERGESSPDVKVMERLATLGYDITWLIAGTGTAPQPELQLDPQLLGTIVDAVRALYKAEGAAIPDRTLGEEAARIYSELAPVRHDVSATLIALGEILADRRQRLRESAATPDRSKRPA
ncbi:helix-turn-helix transcriptional regulator (plasmid) [Tistrella mobilis]|uniref:helix-turn-helix domain-containing protein n=1 Tax=Tistrella mobilis TaxID=171437 RepID=UPI00355925D7